MGALTNRGRSFAEHSAAVLCGVTASIYLVPAIADYFAIKSEPVLNGMSCLAAVFALTLVRSISDEIPRLIAASRAKFVGGDASVENKKE